MTARAEAAHETGERILAAALARFGADYYDDVTLDAIAADAAVTTQTVLRRFGSKDGLVRALHERLGPEVLAQRDEAPAGDVVGAVANLVEHYEAVGDLDIRLIRQEERVPAFADVTAAGRRYHADWVATVFAPWLDVRRGSARDRLLAQLAATCDVQTWHLLRRQHGLPRTETERALVEMLEGVLS